MELSAAVFVHARDMLAAERMERYRTRWRVGMSTETTLEFLGPEEGRFGE